MKKILSVILYFFILNFYKSNLVSNEIISKKINNLRNGIKHNDNENVQENEGIVKIDSNDSKDNDLESNLENSTKIEDSSEKDNNLFELDKTDNEDSDDVFENDYEMEETVSAEEMEEDRFGAVELPISGDSNTVTDVISANLKHDDEQFGYDIDEEGIQEDGVHLSETEEKTSNNSLTKRSSKKGKIISKGQTGNNGADKKKLSSWYSWSMPSLSTISDSIRNIVPDASSISGAVAHLPGNLAQAIHTGRVTNPAESSDGLRADTSSGRQEEGTASSGHGTEQVERAENNEQSVGSKGDEKSESEERRDENSIHQRGGDNTVLVQQPSPPPVHSPDLSVRGKTQEGVLPHDPYERVLGWEFGNVHVPGTNPYISSKESDSLELINLTSWDKETIIKQNEDVKEEREENQVQQREDIEEEENENELEQAEINIDDETEEEEVEEEEDVESDEKEKEEKKEKENINEQNGKTLNDNSVHNLFSDNYKHNGDKKKTAQNMTKTVFSLLRGNREFNSILKGLEDDITYLFLTL
ncbi:merozoite surface protein 3 [Plasmodium sp. gorilla clade G2]|uniref:merozoite surface protein 3 n=1 Tax=Plasmodium sp. gorilla clade G2 TaxID=880535 RepID=UPI000D201762|nr:merozoite surface protein 3 [Plasmodium sp. gorilla clade G2]SOV15230.1 merozoite surface protein 3 [Plasmodium sp. gorilla clade G2]